ncbi:hypothetical protein GQ43DRAFT_475453 [Delitschia confertaspora ATCC 74209]|uniref:Erythromycin esterase n=1 Tax=Delitschia confertaspora ATCC 74209 TaxID=1513339 RepID=A0A9P4JJ36_9PLEO|nr:hypothetical protein GQ43DRAFT_475453 [Delitschia confertaspora ATCC 74209]
MARRSARLQKRSSTTSSKEAEASTESFASTVSHLETVTETNEPITEKNVSPVTEPEQSVEKKEPVSQLPQPVAATTPSKNKTSTNPLQPATARTPKNRTPIMPSGKEMHPEHHHPSTAKAGVEARWLGLFAMGAHTAPPRAENAHPLAVAQATPTKATTTANKLSMPSADFKFRFRSPSSELSPQTTRIMQNNRTPQQPPHALKGAMQKPVAEEVSDSRKIAVPKGKAARFSDIHMKEFKKMDSIANHPSAFRAAPDRFKPVDKSLKRSPSKADLDKPQSPKKAPAISLKRTQSKMDYTELNEKIEQSKSTIRVVRPSGVATATAPRGALFSPAKRVKHKEDDDAATNRPVPTIELGGQNTPRRGFRSALPRSRPVRSGFMSPTKAALARSQSATTIGETPRELSPSQLVSPSTMSLIAAPEGPQTASKPTVSFPSSPKVPDTVRKARLGLEQEKQRNEQAKKNLEAVKSGNIFKSILRNPNRKFSDDPEKVAAGTHMMSPPPGLGSDKPLPPVPATAPVRKHVNFTASTLEKPKELIKVHEAQSPSPTKPRSASEALAGSVVYPALQSSVDYPKLPENEEASESVKSPSRRLTFGLPGSMPGGFDSMPHPFDFTSNNQVNFGPATKGTIRLVSNTDSSAHTSSLLAANANDAGKKRKAENDESGKENNTRVEEGDSQRSPKKVKMSGDGKMEPPKTPASKLPQASRRLGSAKSTGGKITMSRLAMLATPKRLRKN